MNSKLNTKIKDAALAYANRGMAIFPCSTDKKPLTQQGFKDATTDIVTIEAWWSRWPNASIGLPTGTINRIVVLDIDTHGASNGFKTLKKLASPKDLHTLTAETGGGGRHYFYKYPGSHVPNSAGKIGKGIDVRGDGGYVILTPSQHQSGTEYRWLNHLAPAPMPIWLMEQIQSSPTADSKTINHSSTNDPIKENIEQGSRNDSLFRYGSGLRAGGMEQEDIIETLMSVNRLSCKPPLDFDEVEAIAASASKYDPDPDETANAAVESSDANLTDLGNASRFVSANSCKLRYIPQDGKWLMFDGTRWKLDELGNVQELAKATARSIYSEACNNNSKHERQKISWWAEQSCNKSRLTAMIDLSKSDPKVSALKSSFDQDPFKLNVLNGTLNLKSGALATHSPDDLITRQSPVVFDPKADCPRFKQFLSEITAGDVELQAFMQKMVGYCLTGDTSEQVFFILHGFGANGKTVFLETISRLLGDYAATTDFETFLEKKSGGPRNDLVALRGCRFASGSEIGPGGHLDETVIKQVTGQDTISARKLYQEFEEFKMSCKLFLATNHLPNIRGTENGIWRRIRVIPFEVCFSEDKIDKHLQGKLIEELPGILNWAIKGCHLWQKEGLIPPTKVTEAGANYRLDTDSVEQFISEKCKREPSAKFKASELYSRYCEYCDDAGLTAMHKTTFFKKLTEKGIGQTRSDTTYRTGIRLKTLLDQEVTA